MESNAQARVMYKDDAEKSILGAILLDNADFHRVAHELAVNDFGIDSHRIIYLRISQLAETAHAVDLVTLVEQLDRHKELEKIGGVGYIAGLLDGVPDKPSIGHYVSIVRDAARRRTLAKALELCALRVQDASENTNSCLDFMLDTVCAIQANAIKTEAVSIGDGMQPVLEQMLVERTRTGTIIGTPTGITQLDRAIGGIRDKELFVIGALPGRGKTAFGLQLAINSAEAGDTSVMFSLEMARDPLIRRELTAATDVGATKIRDPQQMSGPEWNQVLETAAQLCGLPFYVDDSSSLTLRELLARARLYKRRFGAKTIVVDYLRLVKAPGRARSAV